jgi:hypothetical protein
VWIEATRYVLLVEGPREPTKMIKVLFSEHQYYSRGSLFFENGNIGPASASIDAHNLQGT